MLKSTGYFRGIKCPFEESCRRPHCHFKHRGRGVGSVGNGEARRGAEYDPCSPDLPPLMPSLEDGILEIVPKHSSDILELERVNKAIEEVKSEVEREQRKYEELLETQKDHSKPLQSFKKCDPFSPLEYDPGESESNSSCYNPTPLLHSVKPCKYILDEIDNEEIQSRPVEYVPTVTQAPKYKTNKYVIDHSKPHTDMEYDPLSNYSARLLSKNKPQNITKRSCTTSQDEIYAPSFKKLCKKTSEMLIEARFSDSDEEPETKSSPSACKYFSSGTKQTVSLNDKCSQTVKEIAVPCNVDDIGQPIKSHSKNENVQKNERKHSSSKNYVIKDLTKDPMNPVNKSKHLMKKKSETAIKNMLSKLVDHKIQSMSNQTESAGKKLSTDLSSQKFSVTKNSKRDEVKAWKKKSMAKKDVNHKAGDGGNVKHNVKKGKSEKSKEPTQETVKAKTKRRTLSHVDLFGDDSSGEEEKIASQRMLCSDRDEKSTKKNTGISHRASTSSVDCSEMDYSILENCLDSDSDPMEECFRVFNESQDIKPEDKGRMGKQLSEGSEEKSAQSKIVFPGQKKRISHITHSNTARISATYLEVDFFSKPAIHPYNHHTPQEICYQRIQKAQEQAVQLRAQQEVVQIANNTQKMSSLLPGKKKQIARVPDLLSFSSSQSPSSEMKNSTTCNGSSPALRIRTLSGMASKTISSTLQKRQAHMPSLQSVALKRPVIPTEFGAKIPTTVRQRYLNLFVDECLKFCSSQEYAFDKALEEEKVVYNRSTSRVIYLSVAVNTLKKLRNQGLGSKVTTPKILNRKTVSHEAVLGGKLAAKTSFSVQCNNNREEEITDENMYKKLKNYILTPEQLKEHGYPLVHPEKPGRAVVFTAQENKSTFSSCRVCCRCGTEYLLTASGNYMRHEECIHHWGRLRRQKVHGGWETNYNCCSGAVGSTGCQVAKQHVQDGRKENLDGFVKTFEKSNGNPGVFALDCEMCYTTKGLELTRVTIINSQLKVLYDTFVQPNNKIVDYNTRFSGVTEEDLQNTTITLRDVQAVLLCMFSCDTILIGHSLESDLFALKLIHPTVVDTAIVFPHRLGLPYKRALCSLMANHLKRIIQDSVEGHDSSEDACSCMELMIWKIKEDAKVKW